MRAMVLGAGRGTRLGELGLRVPKALVDIAGTPLLERQLAYLHREGVDRVVVNAHHLSEAVEDFARHYTGPVGLDVVVEPELLGTAGGVRNALELLGDEPFLVLYGDVVVDDPLGPLFERHRSARAVATLAVYESFQIAGKGTVAVGADGLIAAFAEKGPGVKPPALVNAGIYVVTPELIAPLPAGVERDFGHDVFPQALAAGKRLAVHRLRADVIDVGTPEGLQRARRDAARGVGERG